MRIKQSWYSDIEEQLKDYFYKTYFEPILELFKEPLYNSTNDVINAINKGRVVFQGDEIYGVFNMKVSNELRKFAKFNKYTKRWKIKDKTLIPKDILSASIIANEKARQLHSRMKTVIDNIANTSKDKIGSIDFNIDGVSKEMDAALNKERIDLGVRYTPNDYVRQQMVDQYNENMKLSIVNELDPGCWDTKQVERLREMVSKMTYEGYNRQKMIEAIQTEFETSKSKARFLARQETTLFYSDLSTSRFTDAGIHVYQWLTMDDYRVVGDPSGKYPDPSKGHGNHYVLHKKFCKFNDDSVYADTLEDVKNNKWKSRAAIGAPVTKPGLEFFCRCVKKPIIL
jgi:hypothetical protein